MIMGILLKLSELHAVFGSKVSLTTLSSYTVRLSVTLWHPSQGRNLTIPVYIHIHSSEQNLLYNFILFSSTLLTVAQC